MHPLLKSGSVLVSSTYWRHCLRLIGLLVLMGTLMSLPRGVAAAAAAPPAAAPHVPTQALASLPAFSNLNDYPWQGLFDRTLQCPPHQCADGWGMGYSECVSYAAWKAYEMAGGTQHPPTVPDEGWMPSDKNRDLVNRTFAWGNAGDWANNAQAAGIPLDPHPFIGDIAEWDTKGVFWRAGHVAFVYQVNGDGSLELAQYNLLEDGTFSTMHMPVGGNALGWVPWPDHFIHLGYQHMQGFSQFGSARYQLHSDGSIWLYQGPPMTGWLELDKNPKTTAIATDGSGHLYQLHYDGTIWQYLGPPITGWKELDNNPKAIAIATDGNGNLYQLHTDGTLWQYLGPPMTGWQELDNNPKAIALATDGNGKLYQLHNDGSIWRYQGPPITGWLELDKNPKTTAIAADGNGDLYQLHTDGSIWLYQGPPITGWLELDNNPKTVAIAADSLGDLYQLHTDGSIWLYQGPPITGWLKLDNNPKAMAIAADGGGDLYELHTDGSIWRYQGPPITGWLELDNNPKTVALSGAY